MVDGSAPRWRWTGAGTLTDNGCVSYKSVEKDTPGVGLELYTVSDVVTIDQNCEEDLWIAQVTELFQEGEGTDGMYMRLRWFYSRAQLTREVDISDWEAKSTRHRIAACELVVSDHIESEPNHVLNITGRVLLASGRSEYAELIATNNEACHKRFCRMFYNPKHSEYIDGLAFRFLEKGELRKLLSKASNSEIFYRPMDRKAARSMVDSEVEVSRAICENDEMEKEERVKLKRVKRFVTKKIAIESGKLASTTDRLEKRISRLESRRELEASRTKDQETLLKEITTRDEQIQFQGVLISSLSERISTLESLHSPEEYEQSQISRKLDKRMKRNEKVRLSVEKKREKRRRYRANRAKARSQATCDKLPTEDLSTK